MTRDPEGAILLRHVVDRREAHSPRDVNWYPFGCDNGDKLVAQIAPYTGTALFSSALSSIGKWTSAAKMPSAIVSNHTMS
jgi:hypothetical protein